MNYKNIITIEPGKRGGKPCIRGMRITVYDVLEYFASEMTQQEILEDFPYLTSVFLRKWFGFVGVIVQRDKSKSFSDRIKHWSKHLRLTMILKF